MPELKAILYLCALLAPHTAAQDTVALIVGGNSQLNPEPAFDEVELFGCPGKGSIPLSSYPSRVFNTGNLYLSDEDRVLVCGGYSCPSGACQDLQECYYFNPTAGEQGTWELGPDLLRKRFNFLMASIPNKNNVNDPNTPVPAVLGYGTDTEIFDPSSDSWTSHEDLSSARWTGLTCFTEYEGTIYSLFDDIITIDPSTWTESSPGELPRPLARSGKCVGTVIDGNPGIFLRYGRFYNLNTGAWEKYRPQPHDPTEPFPNNLYSFQERPTVFGSQVCFADATCAYQDVVQYQWESNAWTKLGEMTSSKTYMAVIEVPVEWCDIFEDVTTPPTTTPTTSTGTSTPPSLTTTTSAGQPVTTDDSQTTTTAAPTNPPTTAPGGASAVTVSSLAILVISVMLFFNA